MTITPRAWLDILCLSFIWGGSFLAMRIAQDDLPVFTVVAHRIFWATLVLWAIVLLRRLPLPTSPRIWGALLVMGFFNNVLPFCLIVWAQETIETGLVSILNATTAIFGVLLASLVFADERLTPRRAIGIALGFLGCATAIGLDSLRSLDLQSLAQLAILGSSLSYAIAGAWGRKTLQGLRPEVAAAGMLAGSTLLAMPFAWLMDGPPTLKLAADTWAAIAYVSVLASGVAYLLYYRILAAAGAGNVVLCTLLVAPIAIVLGALFRNESLPPQALAGFALLALGLLVLDGRLLRRRHRGPQDSTP
ncbi:MAG: DMT family transporter [Pseudomonadota bacterium]